MTTKKAFILLLIITLFSLQQTQAQCTACTYTPVAMSNCPTTPPKPRGLYVNEFFNFNSAFYGPQQGIDAVHSILGVDANKDGIYEKEDALLAYCKLNKFSRITVYDIWNVLRFPTSMYGSLSYSDHLKRFITKAKTGNYGITEVGVTIWNPVTPSYVAAYNGISSNCILQKMAIANTNGIASYFKEKDAPDEMEENEHNTFYPANLSTLAVENEPEIDDLATTSSARVDALNSFKIDHMVSEFEFWNTNTFNTVARRDSAYRVFQNMMNYMQCMRSASVDPLNIYVYLGYLDKDSYDDKTQAQFIDNIADKIYISNYKCNPNSLFLSSIQSRIDIFSAASGPTKANTKIVILLCGTNQSDAIANDPFNSGWCDFLGPFLKVSGNTMACAEGLFKTAYDNYKAANPGKWNSTLNSFQWYPYTILKKNSVKRLAEESTSNIASEDLFSVFPNPVNSSATFAFSTDADMLQDASLTVFDNTGKVIAKHALNSISNNQLTLDLSSINSGLYFCKIVSPNWSSTTSKLVVVK